MKRCTKCGEEKDEGEFSKDKSKKGGFRSWCRRCESMDAKARNEKNKKHIAEYHREYYAQNREKRRAYHREYYAQNREKLRAASDRWRAENPEKRALARRSWKKSNRESCNLTSKSWRGKNRERVTLQYVKAALKKELGFAPPQELVELKTEQLKMYRATASLTKQLKEMKNDNS